MAKITKDRAILIRDAYGRDGGFTDGSHLDQFAREEPNDYTARKAKAFYDNLFKPACVRYAGYLSRNPASRTTENPVLESMLKNIDGDRTNIQSWMMGFAKSAKPYGCGLGVVDMPDEPLPSNLSDQINRGLTPYFSSIEMSDVDEYSLNSSGHIDSIKISRLEKVGTKTETVVRYWDTERQYVQIGGSMIEKAVIGGLCPVVDFSEENFPYEGEFSGVADLQDKLYQLHSQAFLIIDDVTFPILAINIPPEYYTSEKVDEMKTTLSTKNAIPYFGNEPPDYVSPKPDSSETIEKKIEKLENRIKEITHTIEQDSAMPESGVAKEIRFRDLNSSLSSYAERMESFERRMWDVVCAMTGISRDAIMVSWPRDFAMSDPNSEFLILQQMVEAGFPEEAILEKKKQITKIVLPSMDDETEAAINEEFTRSSVSSLEARDQDDES